jgi:hypothetical protein
MLIAAAAACAERWLEAAATSASDAERVLAPRPMDPTKNHWHLG